MSYIQCIYNFAVCLVAGLEVCESKKRIYSK